MPREITSFDRARPEVMALLRKYGLQVVLAALRDALADPKWGPIPDDPEDKMGRTWRQVLDDLDTALAHYVARYDGDE